MQKKLNILLTNDDGYNSLGLNILRNKLKDVGNIYVFAPLTAMSGKSCSATFQEGLTIKNIEDNVFAVDGTPADCVSLGVFYLKNMMNIDIDLVISGSNAGVNISYDTLYSGTIGACLDAGKYGLPTIAFSGPEDFRFVEDYCLEVFNYIVKNNLLSSNHIVSVNFPYSSKIDGIKMSNLYHRKDTHYCEEINGKYYIRRDVEKNVPKDSDCYCVDYSNYISITLLNNSFSNK